MPRPRSRGRSRGGIRPKYTWHSTMFTHSLAASAGRLFTDISIDNLAVGAVQTATCRRMIGECRLTATDTALEGEIAVGVAVVTRDAVVSGALPDPLDDNDQDWYYWNGNLVTLTTGLVAGAGSTNPVWTFDIRSARRLRGGYRLAWISENGENPEALTLHVGMRTLWTVP